MKSKSISSFFVGLTLVLGIVAIAPSAFADHQKVEVTMTTGSGLNQDCAATNSCYDPYDAIVDVGGEVTWINADAQPHTVTSGEDLTADDVGSVFDSSIMMKDATFSFVFEESGSFPYFCQVHPWMKGIVTVQEAMAEEEPMEEEEIYVSGMSSDGSMKIEIESGVLIAGKELAISVSFTDADGNIVEHVNYDISAMQDGTEVLSESAAHAMSEPGTHVTDSLSSDSPVDVQVTILGIGFPGEEANWTGPIGDVVSLQVVPEFGTIAALVLVIGIVSIIAITAKTRVIPKL